MIGAVIVIVPAPGGPFFVPLTGGLGDEGGEDVGKDAGVMTGVCPVWTPDAAATPIVLLSVGGKSPVPMVSFRSPTCNSRKSNADFSRASTRRAIFRMSSSFNKLNGLLTRVLSVAA